MPDNQFSHCQVEDYLSVYAPETFAMRIRTQTYVKKENRIVPSAMSNAKRCHADRAIAPLDMGEAATALQSPKKPRAKPESSQHFGVRFRPDLQKWVAEIRVAEWKTVDKKVWLGTFDSEEGAARAVDAARKMLGCKKKRPFNFPCDALEAYAERIPAELNINNLRNDSMFKEVTLFVKRKAQEYAAGFCPGLSTTAVSIAADQIPANMKNISSFGSTSSSAGTSPEVSSPWLCFDPYFEIGSHPHVEECEWWKNMQTYQNRENHNILELDMDTISSECYNEFAEAAMDHETLYNIDEIQDQNQTYGIGDAAALEVLAFNSYQSSLLGSSMDYSTQVC